VVGQPPHSGGETSRHTMMGTAPGTRRRTIRTTPRADPKDPRLPAGPGGPGRADRDDGWRRLQGHVHGALGHHGGPGHSPRSKASLVAGFFMHLLSEKKLIYAILTLTVLFFHRAHAPAARIGSGRLAIDSHVALRIFMYHLVAVAWCSARSWRACGDSQLHGYTRELQPDHRHRFLISGFGLGFVRSTRLRKASGTLMKPHSHCHCHRRLAADRFRPVPACYGDPNSRA